MIHIKKYKKCTVLILRRELTRSAIYGSQKFDSHKWDYFVKKKTTQFRGMFVWIIVFYFYNIFLTITIL